MNETSNWEEGVYGKWSFLFKAFQLIWGAKHKTLQVQGTLEALYRLRSLGFITHGEAQIIENAWALLRRIEHRLHMMSGYQTHDFPMESENFAKSLGFENVAALNRSLQEARESVSHLFDSLLSRRSDQDSTCMPLLLAIRRQASEREYRRIIQSMFSHSDPDENVANLLRLIRCPWSPFGSIGAAKILSC